MLEVLSTERLLPRHDSSPQSVQLSILDSACARFSPTGAIWLYDHQLAAPKDLLQQLQSSFELALTRFPHFAGQLCWASSRQNGHATHFGRATVTFGSAEDPGVEWTTARLHRKASDLVPDASDRANAKVWLGTGFPQKDLMASKTPLALGDLKTFENLPAMMVQVTLLEDAFAVAIKLAHPLADASTLVLFAQHWAEVSRAQHSREQGPTTLETPVFDPQMLDKRARGGIEDCVLNEEKVRLADTLPLHRYDWWATDAEGYPPFMMSTSENSKPADPALRRAAIDSSGEVPPWKTWDFSRSVTHAIIHFTPEQVDELRARVNQDAQRCSRLDAVLAHIWSAINRSRGLSESQEKVFLNMTMGVRARVDPPLPAGFAGSPLVIANVPSTGMEAANMCSEKALALRIRKCVDMFTGDAMGALLHKSLHEVSPQRFWQAFLGRQHILVTAWLRLEEQEICFFGHGHLPRYVHPIMPLVDGCLLVVDGHPKGRGMDISLYLESGAMKRLLEDSELFL